MNKWLIHSGWGEARARASAPRESLRCAPIRPEGRRGRLEAAGERLRPEKVTKNDAHGCVVERPVMILPQVHLRKPCYDFSFL